MKLIKGLFMLVGGGVCLMIALMVVVAMNVPTDPQAVEAATERFMEEAQQSAAKRSAQKLKVGTSALRHDTYASYVSFPVTNTTSKLLSYADFKVYFYDKKGKVIASSIANTTNIPAGETRTLEALVTQLDRQRVARHAVEFGNSMFE